MNTFNNDEPFDHPILNTKKMLRVRAIAAFDCQCSYCGEYGDENRGPDGRSWHLDRIKPGVLEGEYEPHNVTLACAACNISKGAKFFRKIYAEVLCLAAMEDRLETWRRVDQEAQNKDYDMYHLRQWFGEPANQNEACL